MRFVLSHWYFLPPVSVGIITAKHYAKILALRLIASRATAHSYCA